MQEKLVKIVIPIYSSKPSDLECDLVRNSVSVFKNQTIVFLLPESLDIQALSEVLPIEEHQVLRVSDDWLGQKNGVRGYNNMLLSKRFYDLFADVEYILICQSDVFVFSDELVHWCSRGFDYVGAPWLKRDKYNSPLLEHYLRLRKKFFKGHLKPLKQDLFDKIGNGGFSLRKVESFRFACEKYKEEIDFYKSKSDDLHNEDVFWALVPSEFVYPTVEQALSFSSDSRPELCYEQNGNKAPFGCHGLMRKKIFDFWQDKIEILQKHSSDTLKKK